MRLMLPFLEFPVFLLLFIHLCIINRCKVTSFCPNSQIFRQKVLAGAYGDMAMEVEKKREMRSR